MFSGGNLRPSGIGVTWGENLSPDKPFHFIQEH